MKRNASKYPSTKRFLVFSTIILFFYVGGMICDFLPFRTLAMPAYTPLTLQQDEPDRIDVTVKGQYIYLYSTRAVTIRLYSILGQLITQQAIQPGSTRIKAPGRGVYILKAGSITRRVTINN